MLNVSQTLLRRLLSFDWPPAISDGLGTLAAWKRRRRTRSQLRSLDSRRLADIGLTEYARARECAKWFWEA